MHNGCLQAFLILCCLYLGACSGESEPPDASPSPSPSSSPSPSPSYTLTSVAGLGGEVIPATQTVSEGDAASFILEPLPGYAIATVSGCGGSLNGTTYTTAAVYTACNVTASFSLNQYSVTTNAGAGGSISPSSQTVGYGQTTDFTLIPDLGFRINSVSGCEGNLADRTYTTGAISAACSVSATFGEVDDDIEPAAWQLPFDAFDYVMESEIVAPRPMDELRSSAARNSPYLWGHPDVDYVRPLHARGGAWPYFWEVVSAPEGTTIGEFLEADADGVLRYQAQSYSMLRVPKQAEGSVSQVTVRMRDQNWNRGDNPSEETLIYLEITWQADKWVIVSPDGESNAAGTYADPLNGDEFWSDIQLGDVYQNKLVMLRGGDYGVIAASLSLNSSDNVPVVFIAAPDETPILREMMLQPNAIDATIMGLEFNQPFQRYNQYFIRIWGTAPRNTITSNRFVGLTPGSAPGSGDGQDNPSGIMATSAGDGNRRDYLTIARNHFMDFVGGRANFAAYITYTNARSVFEMNRLSNSSVMEGFFLKGPHHLTTHRANIIDENVSVSNSRGGVTAMHFPGLTEEDFSITGWVEHCWNHAPTGNLALLDRASALESPAVNPNFMYRNTGNGVLTHTKQREQIPWHIFNNISLGVFGVAVDTPSGRWPSAIGVWPVQFSNAHIKNDLMSNGILTGDAERVRGYKGSVLTDVQSWPAPTLFNGIESIGSYAALDAKNLTVTIGEAGRNRMLVLVSFQSGGNGRGQGYHLGGIYGQTAVFNPSQYNNMIISFFDDRLLPREGATYNLVNEESGTESVVAIYAEGVAQEAPETFFTSGDTILGSGQFTAGDDADLVLYGSLLYDGSLPPVLDEQTYLLQGDDDARHHGLWRMGSNQAIGVDGNFNGLLSAARFKPAVQ